MRSRQPTIGASVMMMGGAIRGWWLQCRWMSGAAGDGGLPWPWRLACAKHAEAGRRGRTPDVPHPVRCNRGRWRIKTTRWCIRRHRREEDRHKRGAARMAWTGDARPCTGWMPMRPCQSRREAGQDASKGDGGSGVTTARAIAKPGTATLIVRVGLCSPARTTKKARAVVCVFTGTDNRASAAVRL